MNYLSSSVKSLCLVFFALTYLTEASAISSADSNVAAVDPVEFDRVAKLKLAVAGGGKKALGEYEEQFLVVCFTSNTCPYSVDYEKRLKQLQSAFRDSRQSAVVVAINSNDHKDDTLEKMANRAKGRGFNFDYLKDESQDVARVFDAIYTPEFFVLNKQRRVVYQGALDDATKQEDVTVNYVVKAIEAVQSGGQPKVSKTGARGCRIRFQRRRRTPKASEREKVE